ncbi:hypothetical protein MTBPR1_50062 [Candidatus Terasakiella magnetica]|uniref:Uncharacterized protein n=1 Tax=Candidatus Terasakiella magnetica TaxID=1867952 RepID=A0A1C3RJ68_9PROT|nr:hypothetical protein MTBPR1_50062 [Candidatus Terasakiella magnetica]
MLDRLIFYCIVTITCKYSVIVDLDHHKNMINQGKTLAWAVI